MKILGGLVAIVVLGVAPAALARERVAVYVSAEGDSALAENLSEVIIAKLAEKGAYELVGTKELETSARGIPTVQKEGLDACIALPTCLAELGGRANLRRALLGSVHLRGYEYEVELRLVRTDTFQTEQRKLERTSFEVASLIGGVQAAVVELMDAASRTNAAASNAALVPGLPTLTPTAVAVPPPPPPREAPKAALTDVPPAPPQEGTSWTTYAGFGTAGLAVVAFSAAAIAGGIAASPPGGDTRQERQDDIERREEYATAANVALVAGGILTASAVVFFVWP
ncbi:MAG TPA: hypothetical protein VMS65_05900 [Polyangiaceae bacterium]|nr:hypothetical protein [Polyangiaceae bacterium]